MARALRVQYAGAYYHVTCRGNERRAIYRDEQDRALFKEKLQQSMEIYAVELHGYVLMSNHFHLLVKTPQSNLSEFMRHFNISYTSAHNRRHRRVGHLYQGRYKSFLIDADNYLLAVSRYIHLNPVKIKKHIKRPAQEQLTALMAYRDSSFLGYISPGKREPFVHYKDILNYMGADSVQGRTGYREFVLQAITEEVDNPMLLGRGSGIIGDNCFIEWIKEKVQSGRIDTREQPALNQMRVSLDAQVVIARFCEVSGYKKREVCCRGNRTIGRAYLMELLYRYCNVTQPEIGKLVGNIDYSAVSQARKRIRALMAVDKKKKRQFEEIEKKIVDVSR